jgi:hypothetical protein
MMEQIINKLLEKEPDLRYQTAADLRADLKRLHRDTTSGHSVISTAAQNAPLPVPTKASRSRTGLAIVGLVIALAMVGALAWSHFDRRGTATPTPPGASVLQSTPPQSENTPPPVPPIGEKAPPQPPAANKPNSATPQNVENLSNQYARDLQKSITSQVNQQVGQINAAVADQLRQAAGTLSQHAGKGTQPSTPAAQASQYPCAEITNACKAAGFVKGSAENGNGIGNDCIVPIIDGTPQPENATIPLPKIDPDIVARCKAANTNYGHFGKKRATPSDSDSNPQ